MIDWDDLRHFLAIARTGTLTRAGARLRMNPTTVGRRLGALEEEVGARLFERTPDGWILTQAGRDLLPRAERMEAEAAALEREIAGADRTPSGVVRVSVTEMIGTRFIAPHLEELSRSYPDLTVDLNCTARDVSLARREADIALRLARPGEQGVVTKRLSRVPLALFASEGYLERHGAPPAPELSLEGHRVIAFASTPRFRLENDWLDKRLSNARVVMRSDSVSAIYSATVSGLGIALLPRAVADDEPTLRRLVTKTGPEPRVIWLAVHEDLKDSARVRAVLEFLSRLVGAQDARR